MAVIIGGRRVHAPAAVDLQVCVGLIVRLSSPRQSNCMPGGPRCLVACLMPNEVVIELLWLI